MLAFTFDFVYVHKQMLFGGGREKFSTDIKARIVSRDFYVELFAVCHFKLCSFPFEEKTKKVFLPFENILFKYFLCEPWRLVWDFRKSFDGTKWRNIKEMKTKLFESFKNAI